MSLSSNDNLIPMINNINKQLNRSFSIFILIFGTIGNTLNYFVLSHQILRSNSCSFLFLISSIVNIISLLVGVPTRILASWNIDPTDTITWLCKCRVFIVFTSRTIAFWLIVLATINRWASSSINIHHRKMSTLKNAKRSIRIVIILSICLYIQIFYCYEANLINTPLKCYGKTKKCRLINDLIYSLITILLPLILIFIFGLRTISNIRQIHNHIRLIDRMCITHPINEEIPITYKNKTRRQRKSDRYLLFMLFVEVIILTLFTLPQAIEKLYSTFTINLTKSEYHNAMHSLVYDIVLLLSFLASGMPFYIYTLAGGTLYQNVLRSVLQNLYRKIENFFS
jgi:hypothetical protein